MIDLPQFCQVRLVSGNLSHPHSVPFTSKSAMPTNSTPPLVTALRKKDAYLDSVSKIRFQETVSSYLFKAGNHFYKIKKADSELTLIHPKGQSFFSSCRNKLGWSLGVPVKNS